MKPLFSLKRKDIYLLLALVISIAICFVVKIWDFRISKPIEIKEPIVSDGQPPIDKNSLFIKKLNSQCSSVILLPEKSNHRYRIKLQDNHNLILRLAICLSKNYKSDKYKTSDIAFEANKELVLEEIKKYYSEYTMNKFLNIRSSNNGEIQYDVNVDYIKQIDKEKKKLAKWLQKKGYVFIDMIYFVGLEID